MNERIKTIRKKYKMTQIEFANSIGIAQSSLSAIEKGTMPSSEIIIEICKKYNISADWILFGIENNFLTDEENQIIKGYRSCTDKEKGRIEEIIHSSESNKAPYDKVGNL